MAGVELIAIQNKFPEIIGALHVVGKNQVKKAAMAIAAYAAANHDYQNQTGQAQSGFYITMQGFSTYGQGFISGNGTAGSEQLPEVAKPKDDQTAYISNASAHFIYLELGTAKMRAYPSLIPALEIVRAAFQSGATWEIELAKLVGL